MAKNPNQTKTELTLLGASEYVKPLELSHIIGARWCKHINFSEN